ncbi:MULTISPECIES: FAD/NAD(P)-binding protein [Bacillus cereus group]|uniref:FAD/NAD(P)-binding protein n=1 Tax=Bacillus cereus group TaxID=86661 RepID=UPI001F57F008|nr:FAD/NAD(P)-binding protein [Bacillus cereus]MEB2588740.1 FAD/NAD(P)-binding protein [Bacillus cereus]MEB2615404.1 FAD/NAD(P)-binding protein [Bacillus cereus]
MREKKRLAIIGSGVSGLCTFNYLIKEFKLLNVDLNITMYDRNAMIGPGVPYQEDYDVLLLNRHSQQMSVFNEEPDDFWQWYKKKHEVYFSLDEFLPRRFFGQYLNETFHKSLKIAKDKNIYVDVKFDEVVNIQAINDDKFIVTSLKDRTEYDYVILCLGHTKLSDYYELKGNEKFIYDPYPLIKTLNNINDKEDIGILGSSLTSIDVSVVLKERGHQGKIHMLSRNGLLPAVRGNIQPYKLNFFTEETLNELLLKNNNEITLEQIINILSKECQYVGLNLNNMVYKRKHNLTPSQAIESDMKNLNEIGLWQSILMTANDVISEYWYYLNPNDKMVYLKKYERLFMSERNPMPILNAKKILEMLNENRLVVKKGIKDIKIINDQFQAYFKDSEEKYGYIVNAVGSTKYLHKSCRDQLLDHLIEFGTVKLNNYGGIEVDFKSGSIINANGKVNKQLKALGHITCGTYYFTSSVEMISKQAKLISNDILEHMSKIALVSV